MIRDDDDDMVVVVPVYIGPSCLRFCSGRGHCSRTGCKYERLSVRTAVKNSLHCGNSNILLVLEK